MTRVLWYGAVLPALAIALFSCKPKPSDSGSAAADPVVLVGRENIAVADSAQLRSGPAISGSLEPKLEARVRAEIMGPVEKTYVDEGQRVKPGVLLAKINDNSVRDAYLSARSAVRTAESALQNARRNAERSSRLAQAGAVSDRDLETAQQAQTNAEGALADAQARLASAQKQLANTEVRAPISGIVSERQVAAGDVVQVGGAMFTIVDLRTLRLEATVPVEEIGRLKVGTPVEFGVSGFDRRFTGKIERINPAVDPATRQVRIYVSIPNSEEALVVGAVRRGSGRHRCPSRDSGPVLGGRPAGHRAGDSPDQGWKGESGAGRAGRERRGGGTDRGQLRNFSGRHRAAGIGSGGDRGQSGEDHAGRGQPLMFISDFAIRRPIVTVTAMVALVVFGIFALLNLHTDEFPDIQQPVVGVTIVYPGASPSEVTREIIDPVEDAIFGISGVDGEKSTCSATDGLASCTIFFEFEKPIQQASQDIRDAISTKRADLPTEMEEPVLTRFDPSELPVVTLTLTSATVPATTLTRLADPGVTRALRAHRRRGPGERGGWDRAGDDGGAAAGAAGSLGCERGAGGSGPGGAEPGRAGGPAQRRAGGAHHPASGTSRRPY